MEGMVVDFANWNHVDPKLSIDLLIFYDERWFIVNSFLSSI